ncbi:MAG: M15 family metallopeptidase [Tissierellales bacterium]|nr:M15 family metallopeptidase [Tissierellales bacterium]MBN2827449.1 M15 family metallopeptidase [Tissierellales bacterium]
MSRRLILIILAAGIMTILGACHSNGVSDTSTVLTEPIETDITGGEFKVLMPKGFVQAGQLVEIELDRKDIDFEIESLNERLLVDGKSLRLPDDAITGERFRFLVLSENKRIEAEIMVANTLTATLLEDGKVSNPNALDVVINKSRSLPEDYAPEDLVTVQVPTCLPNPEIRQLRKEASEALFNMFEAAKKDDIYLVARSGYRSYLTQVSLYDGYVNNYGQEYADKYSALPGQSEHQTGLAMDITAESVGLQLEDSFGDTNEGQWVNAHAHEYGFIIRYPEGMESITGYLYEPWHLRYLGVELASLVWESGLTLEEYFETLE